MAMTRAAESGRLETRVGPLSWRSTGSGPAIVFFAGALANQGLWRDVIGRLEDRLRCITVDLPLGAHPEPLPGKPDRSVDNLAQALLDCLDRLDLEDATVVANDTAGGLLLISLATEHPALRRIGRLVLTNCESYEKFPPDALKQLTRLCRRLPRLARALIRLQLRSSTAGRKLVAGVSAAGLDHDRQESFFGPARRSPGVIDDFVAAQASVRPQLLIDAAAAIPRFERPVLLIWGDSCEFFPTADAERLAGDFPRATLVPAPGAKTWVPVDDPTTVSEAIGDFVPQDQGSPGR
jgi:pimeloyl-ACP methyl ester carboxylesterase